jgi:ABC-type transport system substrate-binding protein
MTDLIIGARAVVDAAKRPGSKFDYDRPIEGLRAGPLRAADQAQRDQLSVGPGFLTVQAVAREVVEAAGGDIRTHPVGTGPYRLREWKRGSKIVLEANPDYRPLKFPASSNPADAEMQRSMRGKGLPQIGVIDISIIEEDTTLLLEFERGALDYVELRAEVANRLLADDKLKPEYAARGIVRHAFIEPFLFFVDFNMEDPVVGGMSNDKIALRRAIAMGLNAQNLIDVVYAGQGQPANQMIPPGVSGHDPTVSARSLHDPAAAQALLDRFGYKNRDADGYRKTPDGKPLTVILSLRAAAISREMQTLWKRDMDVIGIRIDFRVAPFQDFVKDLIAGKYQMSAAGFGGIPTGDGILELLDSRQPPFANQSRFKSAEYDQWVDRFLRARRRPNR